MTLHKGNRGTLDPKYVKKYEVEIHQICQLLGFQAQRLRNVLSGKYELRKYLTVKHFLSRKYSFPTDLFQKMDL